MDTSWPLWFPRWGSGKRWRKESRHSTSSCCHTLNWVARHGQNPSGSLANNRRQPVWISPAQNPVGFYGVKTYTSVWCYSLMFLVHICSLFYYTSILCHSALLLVSGLKTHRQETSRTHSSLHPRTSGQRHPGWHPLPHNTLSFFVFLSISPW